MCCVELASSPLSAGVSLGCLVTPVPLGIRAHIRVGRDITPP